MRIYTHCWELMNSVESHGSSSLLFMMKVMVCHFVSDSHEVMTALIVVLPLIVVDEISLQLHRSCILILLLKLAASYQWELCQKNQYELLCLVGPILLHPAPRFSSFEAGGSLMKGYSDSAHSPLVCPVGRLCRTSVAPSSILSSSEAPCFLMKVDCLDSVSTV
jgi:hypothetical protein